MLHASLREIPKIKLLEDPDDFSARTEAHEDFSNIFGHQNAWVFMVNDFLVITRKSAIKRPIGFGVMVYEKIQVLT